MNRQEAILELTRYELQYMIDNAEFNTDLLDGNVKFFASGGYNNWTDGQLVEKLKTNAGNNLTPEQQMFMDAYGKCMAVAPDNEIEYFFEYKDKTQVGTFREQQLIREGITYWGHIEDAWLLWQEARKSMGDNK